MYRKREITCIICPNGCNLEAVYTDNEVIKIVNHLCDKGIEYANNEILNPMRNITTTVKVKNGEMSLVSVRSNKPIPRIKLSEAMLLLRSIEIEAPVAFHQVILEDLLGSGANIVACREIKLINTK